MNSRVMIGRIALVVVTFAVGILAGAWGMRELKKTTPSYYVEYSPSTLLGTKVHGWKPFEEPLPLRVEQAIELAREQARELNPGIEDWYLKKISLQYDFMRWSYEVTLWADDETPGRVLMMEGVRILLDGTIWKPARRERLLKPPEAEPR